MMATEVFNFRFLNPSVNVNELDDLESRVANILPQIFFTTLYGVTDIKTQYRLRRSLESAQQVLDSMI